MDPISGVLAIVGLGMSLFGTAGSMAAKGQEAGLASQESALSQQNTRLQMQENDQRRLAMQISARRQSIEITRKAQLQGAQSLTAGVSQTGGTTSSGVQAGVGQATSGGDFNLQGINQNLQIGNTLFDIQNQISGNQISMSGLQSQIATLEGKADMFKGISAIGGSLAGQAGPLGNILGNFFGNKEDPSTQGPGMPKMGVLYNG